MARILMAEDDMMIALALASALEHSGHQVQIWSNGKLALAAMDEFDPDVIVTDLNMPEMNGVELAKAVKSDLKRSQTRIILVSAYSTEQVVKTSRPGTFDAVLAKPVSADDILRCIAGLTGEEMSAPKS